MMLVSHLSAVRLLLYSPTQLQTIPSPRPLAYTKRAGGEHTYVLLVSHLTIETTYPFRDGAPFLLLIDTSNIWALSTFLHATQNCLLVLSSSPLAVCGHIYVMGLRVGGRLQISPKADSKSTEISIYSKEASQGSSRNSSAGRYHRPNPATRAHDIPCRDLA